MPQRNNKKIPAGLTRLRSTTWPSIFRIWYTQEGRRADWRRHFRKRGFSSWRAWRTAVIIKPFRLDQRQWAIYMVTDSTAVVDWHGGPFPGWKKNQYNGAETRSFRWLIAHQKITKNRKVLAIKKIPKKIFMFGLIHQGRVVILDGMHRCGAIALRAAKGQKVKTNITIALAPAVKLPKLKPTEI